MVKQHTEAGRAYSVPPGGRRDRIAPVSRRFFDSEFASCTAEPLIAMVCPTVASSFVDDSLVLAGIGRPPVNDFAPIDAIAQEMIEGAAAEGAPSRCFAQ